MSPSYSLQLWLSCSLLLEFKESNLETISPQINDSALLQVSGVGVIEDVHVKIGVGDEARWPDSTSPISRAYTHLQDILHYIVLIADSLFGSYQVRHVNAAVSQPASCHECEEEPQVWN